MVEPSDPPRYVSDSAGAPPVPPPGGYRGARRLLAPSVSPAVGAVNGSAGGDGRDRTGSSAEDPPPRSASRRPRSSLGWIALAAAILFALVGVVLAAMGATDAFFSTTMLVLQLVVLGLVVAALVTRPGRRLGAAALTVALVLNGGTLGAVSAVRTAATGSYAGHKTAKQKLWESYPGIKDKDPQIFLDQQSLEELQTLADETMGDVRARLTAQYGLTWVKTSDAQERPERNGYGGESMLVRYSSPVWATTQPVSGYAHKLEVMRTVEEVIGEHGWRGMIAFNDPASGVDPSVIPKMYGGATPQEQVSWEWFSDDRPDPGWFYADITDLANDTTGQYRASREHTALRTGEPLEGLQLAVVGRYMLSAAKADDFRTALAKFP